ncbi:hypothetical protein OTU49_009798 [Cherax quadricarinatus]|uniref:Uncharacterized protein n=1 Tax=Cherax quadricarinatus TaxID=27406 RepID=A0AAW0W9I9_CHEQU
MSNLLCIYGYTIRQTFEVYILKMAWLACTQKAATPDFATVNLHIASQTGCYTKQIQKTKVTTAPVCSEGSSEFRSLSRVIFSSHFARLIISALYTNVMQHYISKKNFCI